MTGRAIYLACAIGLITLPTRTIADWLPERTYCLVSEDDMAPATALCHDNYSYMARLKQEGSDLIVFEKGTALSDDPRLLLEIETCVTRADLSLICMFDAVVTDD